MYQALKTLALPPTSLVLLAVVGLLLVVFGRRGFGAFLMGAATVALYVLGAPYVASRMLAGVEAGVEPAPIPPPSGVEAIVILAGDAERMAPEYGGPTVGELALERLRYGAHLQRRTGLPILVSGGKTHRDVAIHAELMQEVLVEDFRASVRWLETESGNTWENARQSAEMLGADGVETVYLVTHAWHMPRARDAFESAGLAVVPAPTGFTLPAPLLLETVVPGTGGWTESHYAIHERLGALWYDLRYAAD